MWVYMKEDAKLSGSGVCSLLSTFHPKELSPSNVTIKPQLEYQRTQYLLIGPNTLEFISIGFKRKSHPNVSTQSNLANFLTKWLSRIKHSNCIEGINLTG